MNNKSLFSENFKRQATMSLQLEMQPVYPQTLIIPKQNTESTQTTQRGSFIPSSQSTISPNKLWRLWIVMFIVGISPFYVGLTIFLSAAASIQIYTRYFNIPIEPIVAFSMINGVVPLGGIVGSMTLAYVLKHTNRRDIALIHLVATVGFCGITLIPTFQTLLVGRLLLGIICSWENSIGAMLIRDFTPTHLRTLFGAFYYLSRVSGITAIFFIGFLVDFEPSNTAFIVINCIPACLTVLQFILLKLSVPMSPGDLIAKGQLDELRTTLSNFYTGDSLDQAVDNWMRQFKAPSKMYQFVHRDKTQDQRRMAESIFKSLQSKALFLSLKVSLLRQFCGVNYLSLYAIYVFFKLDFSFYKAGPCLINLVQIIATIGGLYINYRFNRRPILIIGTFGICVSSMMIAFFDYYQMWEWVLASQILFVIFAGPAVSSVAWPYPPQIIPPLKVKYNSLISWSGSTIIAVIPIMDRSFQFFIAVAVYLLVSGVILQLTMIQTKDLTLRQVNIQLMRKAYRDEDKLLD